MPFMAFMLPPFAMIQLRHSGVWTEQTWSGHKDAPGEAHLLILETYVPGPISSHSRF